MQLLNGKNIAASIEQKVESEVKALIRSTHRTPCLTVIMVGDNPASQVYVNQKRKACERVGIKCIIETYPSEMKQSDLVKRIHEINHNPNIHGLLIQLPLPSHVDEDFVTQQVSVRKDVDGFSAYHMGNLILGKAQLIPCTAQGVYQILKTIPTDYQGKHAVIVGRSNIVGKPLIPLLLDLDMTVSVCHSKTKNLGALTKEADVVVMAVGRPKLLTAEMVKEGAIVIDVGINRVEGKLVGDVDFDGVATKASYLTPVPGGVGPMTIAILMENVLKAFRNML